MDEYRLALEFWSGLIGGLVALPFVVAWSAAAVHALGDCVGKGAADSSPLISFPSSPRPSSPH